MLMKMSALGEIHLLDISVVPSLLDTTDYVLMLNSIDYWKPKTYQWSLLCAEAPEWRRACKLERDALLQAK